MADPIPIILSRVLRNEASSMERLEKHMANKTITRKTPTTSGTSNLMFTPMIRVRAAMATAPNIPLTLAANVFPRTIADLGEGVESIFVRRPMSLSQTTVIP